MSDLKLLSVNVGKPREVEWHGKRVRTSIFKSPVLGPVRVAMLNLEGDEQSDLAVFPRPLCRQAPEIGDLPQLSPWGTVDR